MKRKYIVSGGGTGGHIFPAISIANAIKEKEPDADILFVGALGRMEMEKVPAAGYPIEGLPVYGFDRKNLFRNLSVVINLLKSLIKARAIIKRFKPDAVIGVGGYASAPVLRAASAFKIPTIIQEQNSYAGITNKLLAKKAKVICVAYQGMDKYFPKNKIVLTGNPVRQDLFKIAPKSDEAYRYFNLSSQKLTVLIVGGSLGARTINQSVIAGIETLSKASIQVIWQTGKLYYDNAKRAFPHGISSNIFLADFLSRMDFAYSVADIVVSRAGASSISELCLLGKPVILVPSPNVAEDHQTKNAMVLVNQHAARMVTDTDASQKLIDNILNLANNEKERNDLSFNIKKLGFDNSSEKIVDEIFKVVLRKGI